MLVLMRELIIALVDRGRHMGVLVAVDTDRDDAGGWRAGHDTPCGGRWPRQVRPSRGGGQYCDEACVPGFYEVTPSAWWRGMRLGPGRRIYLKA